LRYGFPKTLLTNTPTSKINMANANHHLVIYR
jgi:hypothetical protein